MAASTSETEPSTSRPLVAQPNKASSHRAVPSRDVIISIKEKQSPFREAVPCMPFPLACICAVLNIFIPGSGTFVSAFSVFYCGFSERRTCAAFGWNILAAILQLLTVVILVGWIWSIHWGIMFVTLSSEYQHERLKKSRRSSTRVSTSSPPPQRDEASPPEIQVTLKTVD